jgi:CheY-like chemotaxis protein
MPRILLILDDYNEMLYLQTLLKKLGFDVDSLTSTRNISDAILSFNPKFLIMTALGKKVNGIELSKEITKRSGIPRLILLKPIAQSFANGELSASIIDKVMETPVNILKLLKCFSEFDSNVKYDQLTQKLASIISVDKTDEDFIKKIKGDLGEDVLNISVSEKSVREGKSELVFGESRPTIKSNMSEEQRAARYEKFLSELKDAPIGNGGFSKAKVKEIKKLRKSINSPSDDEVDEKKKEFVKALYVHLKKVP